MRPASHSNWRRQVRASWRDTVLLLREFRVPLAFFLILIVGCGALYYSLSFRANEPLESYASAAYTILSMTFLQPMGDFPHAWYLQAFYFIMPVLGIGVLAHGLADFGVSFFNRRARGKEWEMAVASTFDHHVILVGLGHLGYRVVLQLYKLDQEVVVIERESKPNLSQGIQALGIPVIQDDAVREDILAAAGVRKARSIILCPQNDATNLQIALKARAMNPNIEVVIRIFDDDFAAALQEQFGFRALSATGMAAPLFAASATDIDITPPITVEGQPHMVARLKLPAESPLLQMNVMQIEENYHLSIIYLEHANQSRFHPVANQQVSGGDTLAIFGETDHINRFLQDAHV